MTSLLAYLGLAVLCAGVVAVIRPQLFHLPSRGFAPAFFAAGGVMATAGAWWPHGMRRVSHGTILDWYVPESQFWEVHSTIVGATADEVFRAIRAVTPDEIRFLRVLTWIRSPRFAARSPSESILSPNWQEPILGFALRTTFVLLGETAGKEIAVGTVVCCGPTHVRTAEDFRGLIGVGYARAGMNFVVEELDSGMTRLTTETRVIAIGPGARRRFGLYWSFIYPGSWLIRVGWLEAIRKRAERVP